MKKLLWLVLCVMLTLSVLSAYSLYVQYFHNSHFGIQDVSILTTLNTLLLSIVAAGLILGELLTKSGKQSRRIDDDEGVS